MKRLTEVRRAMQRHHESGPTGRDVFKYQTEIPGLESVTTTLRCSREGFDSRVDDMEERTGERQGCGIHPIGEAKRRKKKKNIE